MTRRVGAARGWTVPGLSDAFADDTRRFADAWPTAGSLAEADAAERGETFTVSGEVIWRALFRAGSPLAARFLHDHNHYTLTAPDMLERIPDREVHSHV